MQFSTKSITWILTVILINGGIMKKIILLFMAVVIIICFASCTTSVKIGSGGGSNNVNTNPSSTKKPIGNNENINVDNIKSPLELLSAVWNIYAENDRFSAIGGGGSEADEHVMGKPGKFNTNSTEALDSTLGMPASSALMIDDAASLMHMMNANTFTCGTFHVSNQKNVNTVAQSLKDNILKRQWTCGFPEKLVVIVVGDYVISAFGNESLIGTFKSNVLAVYSSASLIYEENID